MNKEKKEYSHPCLCPVAVRNPYLMVDNYKVRFLSFASLIIIFYLPFTTMKTLADSSLISKTSLAYQYLNLFHDFFFQQFTVTATFQIKGTMIGTNIYQFLTAKEQTATLTILAFTLIETFSNDCPLPINLCKINNVEGVKVYRV